MYFVGNYCVVGTKPQPNRIPCLDRCIYDTSPPADTGKHNFAPMMIPLANAFVDLASASPLARVLLLS